MHKPFLIKKWLLAWRYSNELEAGRIKVPILQLQLRRNGRSHGSNFLNNFVTVPPSSSRNRCLLLPAPKPKCEPGKGFKKAGSRRVSLIFYKCSCSRLKRQEAFLPLPHFSQQKELLPSTRFPRCEPLNFSDVLCASGPVSGRVVGKVFQIRKLSCVSLTLKKNQGK